MYALTLPLKTYASVENILFSRMTIAEKIYNMTLSEFSGRLRCYKQSKEYKRLRNLPKGKERTVGFKLLKQNFKLEPSDYDKYISSLQKHYKKHIDSHSAQKIGIHVRESIEKVMYGKGKSVHFKKFGTLKSVEGKTYTAGIRYDFSKNTVEWLGLSIPVKIKKSDTYAQQALAYAQKGCEDKALWSLHNKGASKKEKPRFGELCYLRLKRELVGKKYKYYVQFIIDGAPPVKLNNDGTPRHPLGCGIVGQDLGVSTLASVSEDNLFFVPLADTENLDKLEQKKLKLQRKLDRQQRANNPSNYNENGTIKRGVKLTRNKSKSMVKTLFSIKNIYRIITEQKRQYQYKLADDTLSQGNIINIENMSMAGLMKKAKLKRNLKTKRYSSRKRFGKVISNYSPSQYVTILKQKAGHIGAVVNEIPPKNLKASQYNHIDDTYIKKPLSQRWNIFNYNNENISIQRDLYSAFLLMNASTAKIDRDKCIKTFDMFKVKHDIEIKRLKLLKTKLPSSMGIA